MELTKKDLEQALDKQTKVFEAKLDKTEKRIIARIDVAQEELARMVSNGFTDAQDQMNRMDMRKRVEKLELDMTKIKSALAIN